MNEKAYYNFTDRRNELSYNFLKEKYQNNFICAKIQFYVPNGSREKEYKW